MAKLTRDDLPKWPRNMSATAASTWMVGAMKPIFVKLKEQGTEVEESYFGQGAENEKHKIGGAVAEIFAEPTPDFFSPVYPPLGGGPDVERAAARFMHDMLDIETGLMRVAVAGQQGRAALSTFFSMQADYKYWKDHARPAIIRPNHQWPMIEQQMSFAHLHSAKYPSRRGTLHTDFDAALKSAKNDPGISRISGGYVQLNENPFGFWRQPHEICGIMDVADRENQENLDNSQPLMPMVIDMPYPMACPQNPQGEYPILRTGLKHLLRDENGKERITPVLVDFSLSKIMGSDPGLTMIGIYGGADPSYPDNYIAAYNIQHGFGGLSKSWREKLPCVFSPDNYPVWAKHADNLREKYTVNRECAARRFGDSVQVEKQILEDGDPAMTCIFKLNEKDIFGRRVHSDVYDCDYDIKDMDDLLEYMAHHGIFAVKNDKNLLRIAQSMDPEMFERGMNRLSSMFDGVKAAPKLAMAA